MKRIRFCARSKIGDGWRMRQSALASAVAICLLIPALGCQQRQQSSISARATLRNSDANEVATAALKETEDGVGITLQVSDLPANDYTVRIHGFGKCDPPHFISSGHILAPFQGTYNSGPQDDSWPVFSISETGVGGAEGVMQDLSLSDRRGDLDRSLLFRPGGASLVIHEYSPEYGAGDKIACGVIHSGNEPDPEVAKPIDGHLDSARQPDNLGTPGKTYRPPEQF